jgi:hypothetical protein
MYSYLMKYKCFTGVLRQVYRCAGVHTGTSLSLRFVDWRPAAIGLHKVREYTHFMCIKQLEDSLV